MEGMLFGAFALGFIAGAMCVGMWYEWGKV